MLILKIQYIYLHFLFIQSTNDKEDIVPRGLYLYLCGSSNTVLVYLIPSLMKE